MYYVFPVCILCILVIQQNSLVYTGQNVSLYILQTAKLMAYRTTKAAASRNCLLSLIAICVSINKICVSINKICASINRKAFLHISAETLFHCRASVFFCYDTYILPPMNSLNIESFMIAEVSSISLKKLSMPSILCASAYSG